MSGSRPSFSLCKGCDKEQFWLEKAWEATSDISMTVGDIGSLRSRPDCPLCRLKLTACVGGAREYSDCGRVGLNSRSNSFQVGPLGTRIVFVKNPEAPAWLPQLGLMITSSQIPFGLVQQWLSLCQETHGPDCVPLPLEYGQNGLQRFRVIDVVSDCIVDAPLNCRYTTLSYVWGNVSQFQLSTDNQQMLMSPGSLRLIYPYLPRTIQDAMLFVSSIGERYIWVDSLCLVQDNREDVDQGVRVMDLIYGGSVLTILAGSGTNANAGLPGVRPRSRHVNQAVETIAPGVKMMVLRHYDHHLRAACYSNRGWTFQEKILSRRVLMFVDNQIYFECRQCLWAEDNCDHETPNNPLPTNYTTSELIPEAIKSLDSDPEFSYAVLVSYYARRELSHQSDALAAFAGILRVLQPALGPALSGLPIGLFDWALLFLAYGQPRHGFPSYTWAGWLSEIQYGDIVRLSDIEGLEKCTWIIWHVRYTDGQTQYLHDISGAKHQSSTALGKPESEQVLPEAKEANLYRIFGSKSLPRSPRMTAEHKLPYPLLQFWTYTTQLWVRIPTETAHTEIWDCEKRKCGSMNANCGTTASRYVLAEFLILCEIPENVRAEGIEYTGPYSKKNVQSKDFCVMMIEWQNGIAKRKGLGAIFRKSIEFSYAGGMIWKEILLG